MVGTGYDIRKAEAGLFGAALRQRGLTSGETRRQIQTTRSPWRSPCRVVRRRSVSALGHLGEDASSDPNHHMGTSLSVVIVKSFVLLPCDARLTWDGQCASRLECSYFGLILSRPGPVKPIFPLRWPPNSSLIFPVELRHASTPAAFGERSRSVRQRRGLSSLRITRARYS